VTRDGDQDCRDDDVVEEEFRVGGDEAEERVARPGYRLLSPSGGESPAISRMLGAFSDTEAITSGASAFATLLTEFLPLAADRRSHPGDDLV
jgi:hypothetical protein